MKTFFSAFAVGMLVLMGGGCAASGIVSSITGNGNVEGKWRLAFELPAGWVMVGEYDAPKTDPVIPSQDVTRDAATIMLQSTEKAIVESGVPENTVSTETYVTSNYTFIRVDVLDARRVIPRDAENLGNGFFFAEEKYYFVTEAGEKYQFVISQNGGDDAVARAIILSAKPVTVFTDAPAEPTAEVQTNE